MVISTKPPPAPSPKALKVLRKRLGLSQAQAAERVGVSVRAWAYWEAGAHQPPAYARLLIQQLADNSAD